MWIEIRSQINCTQCHEKGDFVYTTLDSGTELSKVMDDARFFFENAGWIKLPSGKWICSRHTGQKEAA